MAIELIKEAFKVEELKGSTDIQTLVETEIYLSPNKPNIENILWVQGKVDILNTKLMKDKLILSGLARFNLLYKSVEEENNIHTMEASKEFREELEIQGVDDEMISKVSSNIEYIEWDLEETKLNLKALVKLNGEVKEFRKIEAIKEIVGSNTLQTRKQSINYKEVKGREISYALVKDVLKLKDDAPEIDEIVKFGLKVREVESMVVEDRIITSGEVLVNLIYYGNNRIHSQKGVIPFNHFVEMPGVDNSLKGELEYEVVEGLYEVMGNEIGERRLVDLEIKVRVTGKAYEDKVRDLIVDAYSTKENILLEREEVRIKESVKELKHTENLSIEISEIDADEILMVEGNVSLFEKRITDDGVVIDGTLSTDIQYIDRITGELQSYKMDFPFRSTVYEFEIQGDILEVEANLSSLDYNLKRDGVNLDGKVALKISLNKNRKIYSIREIKETHELIDKRSKPSITVYFVQKGDTLWDIAKRYNTTQEDILSSNNNTTGAFNPGDKIIIEKMVDEVAI